MKEKIVTPGWKPASTEERRAVADHCVALGMSREEAEKFVRYNAIRKWTYCEAGSVDQAAKEWIAAARRTGKPLSGEDRLEELAKQVVELRKAVDQIATFLCLVHGKEGEADIGRVVAEMLEEREALREFVEHYRRNAVDRRSGCGLQREGVEKGEGVDAGGESVGGEGV